MDNISKRLSDGHHQVVTNHDQRHVVIYDDVNTNSHVILSYRQFFELVKLVWGPATAPWTDLTEGNR